MSQLLRRKIAELTLTPGKMETISLPRNYAIRGLALRTAGSVTISGGTTSGTVKDSSTLNILGTLEVRREGKDTLFRLPAPVAHRLNQVWYGTRPNIVEISSGAAQTNTAVNGSLYIPFEVMRGVSKLDTILKAGGLSSLDLLVNVGAASDLVSGGDRAIAVGATAFTLIIETLEELGLVNWIAGDMRQTVISQIDVSATSSAFQIKPIPVGNEYYAFALRALKDSIEDNTIINRIKLKSGSEVFYDVHAPTLQDDNKKFFRVETWPAGYYVLPLSLDGLLNSSLDVRNGTGRDTLEFELDVTKQGTTSTLQVIGMEYIRPQQPARK